MGKTRRHWGLVSAQLSARTIAALAQQQEEAGLEGTFAAQVYGPPFAPLAAAATRTDRLLLASGIAIAFTRSPFETAMAALDLDRMSEGRFVLGLGASIQAWVEGMFGMPYAKPVPQLREAVQVIRQIVAEAHTGRLQRFDGRYYHLDFAEMQPPPPPVRTAIPIWISALRGAMVRLGAEIGDGIIGHPIWSIPWLTDVIAKDIDAGLSRAGRRREQLHVNCWFWTTPNPDRRESIEDARACVAFYAGMAQYEPYFAAHGFGDLCRQLQEGVRRGDFMSVAPLVTDEMASTFVLTGTPDEVRRKLEPAWAVADAMTLIPPVLSLTPEKTAFYATNIAHMRQADG
jgi:probable F420-dependent oxidoreductase